MYYSSHTPLTLATPLENPLIVATPSWKLAFCDAPWKLATATLLENLHVLRILKTCVATLLEKPVVVPSLEQLQLLYPSKTSNCSAIKLAGADGFQHFAVVCLVVDIWLADNPFLATSNRFEGCVVEVGLQHLQLSCAGAARCRNWLRKQCCIDYLFMCWKHLRKMLHPWMSCAGTGMEGSWNKEDFRRLCLLEPATSLTGTATGIARTSASSVKAGNDATRCNESLDHCIPEWRPHAWRILFLLHS